MARVEITQVGSVAWWEAIVDTVESYASEFDVSFADALKALSLLFVEAINSGEYTAKEALLSLANPIEQ